MEVSGSAEVRGSRGVLLGSVGQAEALQEAGTLVVDSHQGAVLLRETAKLLLQTGDLNGRLLVLHQFGQQLPPGWMSGRR